MIPELDRIIRKKDTIVLGKSSYSEYALLIHTDEPWMDIDDIRQSLMGHVFPATLTVTRAYFLLSYSPSEKSYPFIRLSIEGRPVT